MTANTQSTEQIQLITGCAVCAKEDKVIMSYPQDPLPYMTRWIKYKYYIEDPTYQSPAISQFTYNELKNLNMLNTSLAKEVKRIQGRASINKNAYKLFTHLFNNLVALPIEKCAIEINKDNSIRITLAFAENKLLMVSRDIIEGEDYNFSDDILYSYFINSKLLASDVTNLQTFTEGFKKYLAD